jgi:coronin-1B/1C/6
LSTVTGEQQYIKSSAKYFAVALRGGGGPMAVLSLDRPGRFEPGLSPTVEGHTGAVLDFDWNPFDDTMFASASEDTTLKVWSVPDDWEPIDEKGNAKGGSNMSESLVDLVGHRKKVTLCKFHPTAANVLASTAADSSVRLWDIEKAEELSVYDQMGDLTQDIQWDLRGDNYATSCKDKMIRLHDGRTSAVTAFVEKAHEGVKSIKLAYMTDESQKLVSTGTNRQSGRERKVWDLRQLDKPLVTLKLDNNSGVLLPLFDQDSSILYLCGKGDSTFTPYEFEDNDPFLYKLNDGYRSTKPSKGACMVPKRGLDIMGCETARILKVTNAQVIQPLSFIVPRKSDAFQDDVFPPCASSEPAHSASEWMEGSSKEPKTMSLDPKDNKGSAAGAKKSAGVKFRTVGTVEKELKEAMARISFLEGKLKEASIDF